MSKPDTPRIRIEDLTEALGLLTRIPVRASGSRGAAAAWAWPLAGALVAAIATAVGWGAMLTGLPVTLTAALVLGLQVLLTGAMHEDGLADCADGFWGGRDRDSRILIMKDSRIGTYGVVALILSLIARWSAIGVLIDQNWLLGGLVGAAVISRAAMVALMARLGPARDTGLSQNTGRPNAETLVLAAGVAGVFAILFAGFAALPAAVLAAALTFGLGRVALAKIGGQTGDVLGAAQQLAEIGALAVFATVA